MPPRAKKSPKKASSPKATKSPKKTEKKSRPNPAVSPRPKVKTGMRTMLTPGGNTVERTFTLAEKKGSEYVATKGRYVAVRPLIGAKKTSRAAFTEKKLEKKDGASVKFYMMELRRDPATGRLSRDHTRNPVYHCEVHQTMKVKGGILAERENERAKATKREPNLAIAQRKVVSIEPVTMGHVD